MTMTPELAIALATILAKYGPDAAIAIAKLFKKGTTIDEAITALENIKTAEQYLEDAKKAAAVATIASAVSGLGQGVAPVVAPV